MSPPAQTPVTLRPKIVVERFCARFGDVPALTDVSLELYPGERLAVIGPAGSGKTTFLRSLNRLNDLDHRFSCTGRILLDGQDIYAPGVDVPALRRRVGMVYAVPVTLPWSIRENVAYGMRLSGRGDERRIDEAIEATLRASFVWDEVKDRLHEPAANLSGGQKQRLCLARVLALDPEVLVLDEPCSALDPIVTAKIEDALLELKQRVPVILVTNNTKQAARASDRTAFLLDGELVEVDRTDRIFTRPRDNRTNDYIIGVFG